MPSMPKLFSIPPARKNVVSFGEKEPSSGRGSPQGMFMYIRKRCETFCGQ